MEMDALIAHKRMGFWKRMDHYESFLNEERKKGNLMGRIGKPPVGPVQEYLDPNTGTFRKVLMFGSNSYLGLSNEPLIKEKVKSAIDLYGLGEGGSPAFSGYMIQQQELEDKLARLSGHEAGLLVAGGYMANLVWISGLMGKEDVIVYDKNSHASTIDAIKMTGIRHAYYFNTDKPETLSAALRAALARYRDSQIFVTVEGVRSIDGTVADIPNLLGICRQYGDRVVFMLDDAHGLGVLGARGFGTLEHFDLFGKVDLRMSTCSKALGIQGAFLTGSRTMISYMRTMASPYNFTTSLSQPVLAAISCGLDFFTEHPERIQRLHDNRIYVHKGLLELGFEARETLSGIVPIFIRGASAEAINKELFVEGLFANVFAYPTVPPGQERVRLSMMATHEREHLDGALRILEKVGKKHRII